MNFRNALHIFSLFGINKHLSTDLVGWNLRPFIQFDTTATAE